MGNTTFEEPVIRGNHAEAHITTELMGEGRSAYPAKIGNPVRPADYIATDLMRSNC
jgi:hypothetical protein